MEKLRKIRRIGTELDIDYFDNSITELVEIDVFLNYIENFRTQGATHLTFDTSKEWDGCKSDIYIKGAKIEEETDEEYDKRLNIFKNRAEEQEAREKATYLKLKAKYGNL